MVDGWNEWIVLERSGRKTVELIAYKRGNGESEQIVARAGGIKTGADFKEGWRHCCSELGADNPDWILKLGAINAFAPWLAKVLKEEDDDGAKGGATILL